MPFIASVEGQFGYGRADTNQIVQGSNLLIWLDSTNPQSYTSGTTWSNLVSGLTKYNNILVNSVTSSNVEYNGTTNTALSFNGTNQYMYSSSNLLGAAQSNNWQETREMWLYWRGTAGGFLQEAGTITPDTNWFDQQAAMSSNVLAYSVWNGANITTNARVVFSSLTSNTWNHIIWQHNKATNNLLAYVNGVQTFNQTGISRTTPDSVIASFYILFAAGSATNFGYGGGSYWGGAISVFRWYNTILTSNQVLQNYNAERARFGR